MKIDKSIRKNLLVASALVGALSAPAWSAMAQDLDDDSLQTMEKEGCKGKDGCSGKDGCKGKDGKKK